jgi:hypothetical protein
VDGGEDFACYLLLQWKGGRFIGTVQKKEYTREGYSYNLLFS